VFVEVVIWVALCVGIGRSVAALVVDSFSSDYWDPACDSS